MIVRWKDSRMRIQNNGQWKRCVKLAVDTGAGNWAHCYDGDDVGQWRLSSAYIIIWPFKNRFEEKSLVPVRNSKPLQWLLACQLERKTLEIRQWSKLQNKSWTGDTDAVVMKGEVGREGKFDGQGGTLGQRGVGESLVWKEARIMFRLDLAR